MRVRLEIDVELSDETPLAALDGFALMLEDRADVVSAYLHRAIVPLREREADGE